MAELIYGHCRACHMNCPAYFEVENKRVTSIKPVPPSEGGTGVICSRGIGAVQLQYSPSRISYPLKRAGKRGEGVWKRISWDQAIEEIAYKIVELSKHYGPETIVFPGRTGRQDMGWIAHRLARTIGTPNNYYGPIQVCLLPQIHHQVSFGHMLMQPFGVDPGCKLHVAVGNDAAYSWPVVNSGQVAAAQAGYPTINLDPVCGVSASRAKEWLPIRPGTDLAYFMCVIRHLIETNTYEANFVKQWTNAPFLVREDTGALLVEKDIKKGGSAGRYLFWDKNSNSVAYWDADEIQWEGGASGKAHYEACEERYFRQEASSELSPATMPESLDPALFGTYAVATGRAGQTTKCSPAFQLLANNVAAWTFEKTAEITGLPTSQIERTCQLFSELHPVDIFEGAQYMSTNASQYFNAINITKMLTGSVDASFGNSYVQFYPVTPQSFPGEFDISYADGLSLAQKRKRLGFYEHRISCGFAWEEWSRWHPIRPENVDATLNFPDVGTVLNAAETGLPYPVRAIFAISSNWIMHDPTTARWMRLIKDESKIELHVVTEMVMTPTAELADYVLPAQTWMERNYLEFSVAGVSNFKNAFRRAVEPLGEAKHDYDIAALLAHKLEEIDPRYNNDRLLNPETTTFWAGKRGKL